MEPKFKPMDVVKIKHVIGQKFSIHESLVQTCPGGTQIHYVGRIIIKEFRGEGIGVSQIKMMEHELEPLLTETEGLKHLRTRIEELKAQKLEYLKTQDFEKASECRDQEKRLQLEIDLLDG